MRGVPTNLTQAVHGGLVHRLVCRFDHIGLLAVLQLLQQLLAALCLSNLVQSLLNLLFLFLSELVAYLELQARGVDPLKRVVVAIDVPVLAVLGWVSCEEAACRWIVIAMSNHLEARVSVLLITE